MDNNFEFTRHVSIDYRSSSVASVFSIQFKFEFEPMLQFELT